MRVAVLIDADNIAADAAPRIFEHARTLGTPAIRRLYGRLESIRGWYAEAHDRLCEMRVYPTVGPAKNGVDIAMAIDAIDILHGNGMDAFCIVSNDRDFVPLGMRLRAAGKLVHAICKVGDERYREAFDDVLELDVHPIVDAFRELTAGRTPPEMSLGEAGKVLRAHCPGLIATSGKAPLRQALEATRRFTFLGTGSSMRIRLSS